MRNTLKMFVNTGKSLSNLRLEAPKTNILGEDNPKKIGENVIGFFWPTKLTDLLHKGIMHQIRRNSVENCDP